MFEVKVPIIFFRHAGMDVTSQECPFWGLVELGTPGTGGKERVADVSLHHNSLRTTSQPSIPPNDIHTLMRSSSALNQVKLQIRHLLILDIALKVFIWAPELLWGCPLHDFKCLETLSKRLSFFQQQTIFLCLTLSDLTLEFVIESPLLMLSGLALINSASVARDQYLAGSLP